MPFDFQLLFWGFRNYLPPLKDSSTINLFLSNDKKLQARPAEDHILGEEPCCNAGCYQASQGEKMGRARVCSVLSRSQ